MLQLHQPSGPQKPDRAALRLFRLLVRLFCLREIAKAQHFPRIGMNQGEVRGHIGPGTEQINRFVPITNVFLIFCRKPFGRHRLPLSLPVDPFADPKGRPSAFQSVKDQLRIFHPPGQKQITVINPLPAERLFLIQQLHVGKRLQAFSPAHPHALLFHRLCLDKGEVFPQPPVECVAKRNLMVIDIIGYKGCLHAFSSVPAILLPHHACGSPTARDFGPSPRISR